MDARLHPDFCWERQRLPVLSERHVHPGKLYPAVGISYVTFIVVSSNRRVYRKTIAHFKVQKQARNLIVRRSSAQNLGYTLKK